MSNALAFQSTQFEVVDLNGQPWIQSRQLAQALGYSSEKSVSNLYKRNSDEFSNEMSVVINLMTTNGQQEARIFSLRGCYAIAMFARTAIAKSFRVWVLDVLEKLNQQAALAPSPVPQPLPSPLATSAQRKPLDKLVKVWATLLGGDGGVYSRLWTQVDSHLGLISIDSATPEQVRQGIAFVQSKVDALQQKALPEAMPQAPSGHNPYSKREAELLSLLEEIDNIKATTRRAYESLLDRLGEITGPIYKEATRAMGYTGRDRSGRGYASDYVISSLHSYRYQVSEHIRNANECAHDAVRTGITVCRILGAK